MKTKRSTECAVLMGLGACHGCASGSKLAFHVDFRAQIYRVRIFCGGQPFGFESRHVLHGNERSPGVFSEVMNRADARMISIAAWVAVPSLFLFLCVGSARGQTISATYSSLWLRGFFVILAILVTASPWRNRQTATATKSAARGRLTRRTSRSRQPERSTTSRRMELCLRPACGPQVNWSASFLTASPQLHCCMPRTRWVHHSSALST
jgi:hypothetical protein